MSPVLVKELRKLKLRNQGEVVFQNTVGNRVHMGYFRDRIFRPTCKAAGLPEIRLHDLRHTFATQLITKTKDVYYTSKMLGHASIKTTADVYGHLIDENTETRGVDVLDTPIRTLTAPKVKTG